MGKLFGMVCGVYVDDRWWFVSRFLNGLYKMNVTTGDIEYICELPEKNERDKQAYTDMLLYKNNIFFIPAFAENIAIYDVESGKFSKLQISQYYKNQSGFRIAGACIFKHWLFLYPCLSDTFVRINLDTGKANVDDTFICNNNLKRDVFAYHFRHYQENAILYVPLASCDGVLRADLEKFEFNIIDIDNDETGYSTVIKINNELWLAPQKEGSIVRYRMDTREICKYSKYPKEFRRNAGLAFSNFFCFDDKTLYLSPFAANMILKIDRESGCIQEYKMKLSENWIKGVMEDVSAINIHSVKMVEGRAYLMSECMNRLLIIDKNQDVIERPFTLKESDKIDMKDLLLKESRSFNLSDFLAEIE